MMHSTSRIRIAFCVNQLAVGGTELNAIRTAEALDPDRFELRIYHVHEDGPLLRRYEALGIPLVNVDIPSLISVTAFSRARDLAADLRRHGVQILHTHDVYTNILAGPLASLVGGCQVIASRRWWRKTPRSGLATMNRWSYRFASRVLANCESVGRMLREEEKVPARKVVVIENFLDPDAFTESTAAQVAAQRAVWSIPRDAFVVGIVARLARVKNHQMLLHALYRLDNRFHAVFVGDGSLKSDLERLAADLGIRDRVHFVGEILGRGNPHRFFDVSVLCSNSEGFPNSLIEGMAAGHPVVATPVGGVAEVVRSGSNGFLVPLDQPEALAETIKLLAANPQLRAELGAAGRTLVRGRHSKESIIGKLSSLYEDLAGNRRAQTENHSCAA